MTKELATDLPPHLRVIFDLVEPGAKVLDVGCGDGALLAALVKEKQVDGRGLELSQSKVSACVANGLSVIQGDADADLVYYPDQAFDYAVLSNTLQALRDPRQVVRELVRIGRRAIVGVPNFGYWQNRLYLALHGRMPVTRTLPYQWYDTPNIHFCTIRDFAVLCDELGLTVERQAWLDAKGSVSTFKDKSHLANLLGKQGVFVVRA